MEGGGAPGLQGTKCPMGVLGDMCLSPGSGRRHNLPRPELQAEGPEAGTALFRPT